MERGLSFESFAALCDCSIDTLYEWTKTHEEFSEAKRIAVPKSLLFWERLGLSGIMGAREDRFNAATWIYTVKCRFPKYYGEKQEVSHVIDDKRETKALSDEELDTLLIEADVSSEKNT